jgi:uncharacterized membrane protein
MPTTADTQDGEERPSPGPGLMFGIGLGGFIDGIVLHQILQWHHMVSAVDDSPTTTRTGLELNTMADGFFHLATWFVVVGASIVTVALWRQGRLAPSWRFHFGGVVAGWGLFNLTEGLVDHHILGVHHVRDDLGGPLEWDLAFLASGILLIGVGWLMIERAGAKGVSK